MNTQIAYLASPYSHPDPAIKELRFQAAVRATYELMISHQLVYSPIVHNTPIDNLGILGNHETWMQFDHAMLSRCDKLIVLKIEGWEASKGVAVEIEKAKQLNKPIESIERSTEWLENLQIHTQPYA